VLVGGDMKTGLTLGLLACVATAAAGCDKKDEATATHAEPTATIAPPGVTANSTAEPALGAGATTSGDTAHGTDGGGSATAALDPSMVRADGGAAGTQGATGGGTAARPGEGAAGKDSGASKTAACGAGKVRMKEGGREFCAVACRGDTDCVTAGAGQKCTGQAEVMPIGGVGAPNGKYCK